MERILDAAGQKIDSTRPILEINPEHPMVARLAEETDSDRRQDWAHLIFDQAMLSEGGKLENPAVFVRRMNELIVALAQGGKPRRRASEGSRRRRRRPRRRCRRRPLHRLRRKRGRVETGMRAPASDFSRRPRASRWTNPRREPIGSSRLPAGGRASGCASRTNPGYSASDSTDEELTGVLSANDDPGADARDAVEELRTIIDLVRWGAARLDAAGVVFGHGTDNAVDEALALVLHAAGLGPGAPESLFAARLTVAERRRAAELIVRRIRERVPAPYLTGRAWFAGLEFACDARAPRSEVTHRGMDRARLRALARSGRRRADSGHRHRRRRHRDRLRDDVPERDARRGRHLRRRALARTRELAPRTASRIGCGSRSRTSTPRCAGATT